MSNEMLRLQRNLLLIFAVLLLITNLLLAICVNNQEKLVVLVPTIEEEVTVGTHYVSETYLQVRAEQITQLLFNMRDDNYLYNQSQILKQVLSKSKEEFKKQLEEFAQDIKQKKYYYVFNKQSCEVDSKNLTVRFSGELETYLAGKKLTSQNKIFKLSFVNNSGIVNLISFEEEIK